MYNFETGMDDGLDNYDYEEIVSGSEEDFFKQCGNYPEDVQKEIWENNFK